MATEVFYLFFLIFSPALVFIIHLILGRMFHFLRPRSSPLVGAIWSVFMGFFVVAFFSWRSYLNFIPNGWEKFLAGTYGVIVYCSFSICYFILFAMTESARRIRILHELYLSGAKTVDELRNEYGATHMLSVRLDRMVSLKQLKKYNNRYYTDGQMLYWIARVITFWSKLLKFSEE